MTSTRIACLAALLATTLTSGLMGAPPQAQQGSTSDEWCREGGDISRGDDERANYCEVREFTVPAAGATLTVDAAPNGGISVEGADRADIHVRARINAAARTMEQARAIASRIDVVATAERVQATGPNNLGEREGWSVSYRLAAPRRTNLSLKSTNGGISITDIQSDIDFRTVNGGVKLAKVGGKVEGRTSNGGVKVDLDGSTWDGHGLDVSTSNGGVNVELPANYSAHLEAGTVNGGLNVDFPIAAEGRPKRSVSMDIGSGGPTLRIKTENGGVRIRKK